MLASLAEAPLGDPGLVYEPKYDGIRAVADVRPGQPARLWSRLGNEKTVQFQEIADALSRWSGALGRPVVLDGEVVALDAAGEPAGFQQLQGRIHLTEAISTGGARVAFILFDLLRDGADDLRGRPLTERRAALERLFRSGARSRAPLLRLGEQVRGDGRALYERAFAKGWEGLIAKRADSRYESGRRSPDWRKLKIVREQEFVIGGWTEPRHTRSYFGALLLGVREADRPALTYVGHTGTGFNARELEKVMRLLRPLETDRCPFAPRPKTNEKPYWVEPRLVAQIKFTEWTADGKLRHPVYLGLRDDKRPEEVRREPEPRFHATALRAREAPRAAGREPQEGAGVDARTLLDRLSALEANRRDGVLELPGGARLSVTNLHKVFWPRLKLTKGDLFRYYVQAAPYILPAVADRPLVMKRYPNGVDAKPFYQHRADKVPAGVRNEVVAAADGRSQLVGGDLVTLLYMTQLAAISQDPWFSRVRTPEDADYVALDLDPSPGVPFTRVLEVARWIRDELAALGATGVPKTSGADGLHVYIPLEPGTPYEAGLLFCQIVATVVATKHPKAATVERAVKARGRRVYVDYLQNILGKTLASAYSARASAYAGVSAPLTWREVDEGVDREDFTIRSMPARLEQAGDLWARLRTAKGVDLAKAARYADSGRGARTKGDSPKRARRSAGSS